MAKRKKSCRAERATESQANIAEAERPLAESEAIVSAETQPPTAEAVNEARPEPAVTEEAALAETTTRAEHGEKIAQDMPAADDVWAADRVASPEPEPASGQADEQDAMVWAEPSDDQEPVPPSEAAPTQGEGEDETPAIMDSTQMESIIESLLFASDRVLGLSDLKRLLGERDGKKITAAVESLYERRKGTGIEVVRLSNGWHLRTNPENARWVSKLLAGKPMRLSRAMMETLAIVAYRQPVTRPEIDEIRGVDCGPVLKTLLDRGLIRIIGKKEEVGRPLLYGTTTEFLRVFNLRELTELPTLREYAELNVEQQALLDAHQGKATETDARSDAPANPSPGAASDGASQPFSPNLSFVPRGSLPGESEDADPLLDELESATKDAAKILGATKEPATEMPAETQTGTTSSEEPGHEA